ncbi:hypothetical protein GX48_00647 [Paracoccidioides brasiliensis]|nr:hypothetical protein GX48_00647 [Paracoccidioides brasiliensis]
MSRKLKVLVAQVGSIRIDSDRKEAKTALTTFFPRHILSTEEMERFFEKGDDIINSENVKRILRCGAIACKGREGD